MLPLSNKIQPSGGFTDQLPMMYEPVKATTALNRGEVLVRTSGASTIEAGAPTSTTSARAAGILGVYAGRTRAAGDTGTPKHAYVRALEGVKFIFPVEAGAGTARQIGDIIGLESNDGVDLADTTNKIVRYLGVYARNTAGTVTHIEGEFFMG